MISHSNESVTRGNMLFVWEREFWGCKNIKLSIMD